MSRTPTFTTEEIESLLGPRGSIIVSTDNRATVRKWLTAQGFNSQFVCGLALKHMAACYNDTSGKTLDRLRTQAAEAAQLAADNADETPDAPHVDSVPLAPTASTSDAADAVRVALQNLLGKPQMDADAVRAIVREETPKAGIDADAVRAILRDELPSLIPVTRIEITTPTGTRDLGPALRHKQLTDVIDALACGLNVALVGPAGSGKTTAAEQAAAILENKFFIQGAIQGAHELTGFVDGYGKYHRTPTREAFETGGTVCWDELDAGDASGMLVANSATANGYMSFPDQTAPVLKHDAFRAVACMNTYGQGADRLYVGRSQMDGATLDRFVFISWEIDETLELAIGGNEAWTKRVQALRHGADRVKAQIIISPRASINGAKLIARGWSFEKTENATIWKGTDADTRRRIEAAAH